MSCILVVDDEESICWAFREFLGDEGHRVETAASAEEALRKAGEVRPDAVGARRPSAGHGRPDRPARASASGSARSPIVVMTAFGDLETAVRAVEAGAFEYLVKPFDLDQAADRRPPGPRGRQEPAPAREPDVAAATSATCWSAPRRRCRPCSSGSRWSPPPTSRS